MDGGPYGIPVLGGGGRDAHRAVATVDTLHLDQSALLVLLVREANEAVAAGLARLLVRHDLGALARRESGLEQRNQNELVDFVAEVADEDGELGAAGIASINQAAAGSPVQAEHSIGVRNRRAVESECLLSSVRVGKLDEAVAGVSARDVSSI